jgi:hypothetical protein
VELVLHRTDETARAFERASRELGRPVISLRTGDCAGEAERLKAKGVVFVKSPAGWPTAASTRSSTIPAATCSTSTKTDTGTFGWSPGPCDQHATARCWVPSGRRQQQRLRPGLRLSAATDLLA